jgi:hypothetical protein
MRDRHIARVCRSCAAPLARQEHACWRCGTDWATEAEQPRPTLRVIPGGARPAEAPLPLAAAAAVAAERWTDEGGHP